MGGRSMVEECLWMLNVVELFQIGALADLVVGLEPPELEVKMLIRDTQGGNNCNLEHHRAPRSLGLEMIGLQSGTGKNLVKGEGIRREKGRNPMNLPMTDIAIVIIERIGTIEIVIGRGIGTEIGKEKETVAVIVTELVTVIETEFGSVVVTMSVIDIETVIVIVFEKGRVRETLKLKSMTAGVLVIGSLPTIELNQSMRGTGMVKGTETMITMRLRMIVVGTNNLSMGISILIRTMSQSTMSIIEVGHSMIIWISLMTRTIMINIPNVVVINMIEWRRMITLMSVPHLSHVKGRELEIWSVNIGVQTGHFLGNMSTRNRSSSQLLLLLFNSSFNQRSAADSGITSFFMDVEFSFFLLLRLMFKSLYD